jgi:alpha-galactosidase
MMNTEDINATRTAIWSEVPELRDIQKRIKIRRGGKGGGGFNVVNVWTGKEIGCVRDGYSVELESHDAAVLMVKQPC